MHAVDIAILLVLVGAIAFAVRRVLANKGGCTCDCSGCKLKCSKKK